MKSKSGERTLLACVDELAGTDSCGDGTFFWPLVYAVCRLYTAYGGTRAIIVSWIVFRIVNRKNEIDTAYRNKLERTANLCVGAAMCLSGAAMLFIALFSPDTEKGNVIPDL